MQVESRSRWSTPTQTALSVKGLSRQQVAWLNQRHVTEERLDKAIFKVVNSYNRFSLPQYWGTDKSASADGTKWNMYEQDLGSDYRLRYGGIWYQRSGTGLCNKADAHVSRTTTIFCRRNPKKRTPFLLQPQMRPGYGE